MKAIHNFNTLYFSMKLIQMGTDIWYLSCIDAYEFYHLLWILHHMEFDALSLETFVVTVDTIESVCCGHSHDHQRHSKKSNFGYEELSHECLLWQSVLK